MDELKYGDITTIGITASGMISVEFYNPHQIEDQEYETVWLTVEQAKTIFKLARILESKK